MTSVLILCTAIVCLLWLIYGVLADIKHKLIQIFYKDLVIECEDPSDHYSFQIGEPNEEGGWTFKTEDKDDER